MATQSYPAILFPIEGHLALFCKLKKKKKEYLQGISTELVAELVQETFVLDALQQNPQSLPHSSRRGSGWLRSKAEQAAVLVHLTL